MIKKTYRTALLILLTTYTVNAFGQTEEFAIKQVIKSLFDGMKRADTAMIRAAFAPTAFLQTVVNQKEKTWVKTESIDSFITFISKPHKIVYDEQITFDIIKVDGDLAIAWTPYKFYLGDKFSHCGVNSFQLIRMGSFWKIIYLVDTRRKQDCL